MQTKSGGLVAVKQGITEAPVLMSLRGVPKGGPARFGAHFPYILYGRIVWYSLENLSAKLVDKRNELLRAK